MVSLSELRKKSDYFDFLKGFFDPEKFKISINNNTINITSKVYSKESWELIANLDKKKLILSKSFPNFDNYKEYKGIMNRKEIDFFNKKLQKDYSL